jgi:hypothetical protein
MNFNGSLSRLKTVEDARRLFHTYNVGSGTLYAKIFFTHIEFVRLLWWGWDIQKAVQEFFGGPPLVPSLNIFYRSAVCSALWGMFGYWVDSLLFRIRR